MRAGLPEALRNESEVEPVNTLERLMSDRVNCLVGIAAKRNDLFITATGTARLDVVGFNPTDALVHIRRVLRGNQALMAPNPFAVSWAHNRGVLFRLHHAGAGSALGYHAAIFCFLGLRK